MGKYRGDTIAAYTTWFKFTEAQLASWNVKYHELHLGKIDADIFVDDKAFTVNDDGSSSEDLRVFIDNKINRDCDDC